MDEIDRKDSSTVEKTSRIGMRTTLILMVAFLLLALALFFWRYAGHDSWYQTFFGNTTRIIETVSRMRINLLKSTDLEKGAVMAVTDEQSQALADQSRQSADAVERDYRELKGLLEAAGIDSEMKLLKEFNDNWNALRVIDRELLSLAVENTNLKAANLSFTEAAQALADFERLMAQAIDIPASDGQRAEAAKSAFQAVTAAFTIYRLEAPHINEARDEKMDEMEAFMAMNEKQVRTALRNLFRITGRYDRNISENTSSAFARFMQAHGEVVRLSRMNTNVKSLQLSLGRKRKAAAQCEEILNTLQDAVKGRSFKATR